MAATAQLLDRLLRKEITLREYERLCGLDPKETDEDFLYEYAVDAMRCEMERKQP